MTRPAAVHALALDTPFAVGTVNCHLVEDDPLTLVDCGADTPQARSQLETAIADAGHRIEDVERIVITHQHVDHAGMAAWVHERCGAEVLILAELAPIMSRYRELIGADSDYIVELMRTHGVEDGPLSAARDWLYSSIDVAHDLDGATPIAGGDVLGFASGDWLVHFRPGHSPSDTVFHHSITQELLSGDHLLRDISSNPVLCLPLEGHPEPRRALVDYIASLEQTREMEVSAVYPGHGPGFTDHATLIGERLRQIERRSTKMLTSLSDAGDPLTAHELARRIWGDVALQQPYLTLSETVGHMDLLVERGAVVQLADGELIRFATA